MLLSLMAVAGQFSSTETTQLDLVLNEFDNMSITKQIMMLQNY